MPVDENYWPGPTWDFTVWHGAFPTTNSPGDLYINFSGLRYLNTGKDFVRITTEEWNQLLNDEDHTWNPSVPHRWAEFVSDTTVHKVAEGTVVMINGKPYVVVYDTDAKRMFAVSVNDSKDRYALKEVKL